MENQFKSITELEGYLNDLGTLSEEIGATLKGLQTTFSNQQEGWASSNSQKEASKMNDYAEEAKKLSANVETIKTAVAKYKNAIQEEDAI